MEISALVRDADLGDQYEAAWASDAAGEWDVTIRDGLGDPESSDR